MTETKHGTLQRNPLVELDHEHGWRVESRHDTSEGRVVYVICEACGTRRVDLQAWPTVPPQAISRASDPRS